MKTATLSLAKIILFLLALVQVQAALAETDESWYQVFHFQLKLAEQGNVKAQYILGEMYEQGRGVEKNTDTAINWYQKAEQNGHKKAADRIAMIHENIKQEALEKARAAADKKRREEEKARQLALQKQHAEEERRRTEEERSKEEKLAKLRAEEDAKRKVEENKLSPEELAKKIKQAQERAQTIAKQNALRQQQAADAELRKYRASLNKSGQPPSASDASEKYQDPFE